MFGIVILITILVISVVSVVLYFLIKRKNVFSDKIRILMIGDSYTFKNNMPSIFQNILGNKYQVDSHVIPKLNLTVAYADKKVRDMITQGQYNFVILQEHSARILMATKSYKIAVQSFVTLIKSVGAQPVLFEPWAYRADHPDYIPNPKDWKPPSQCPTEDQEQVQTTSVKAPFCYRLKCRDKRTDIHHISKVTEAICSSDKNDYTTTPKKVQKYMKKQCEDLSIYNLPIIYVGEAVWGYSDPSILFNSCDAKHPTLAGSYLIALMLYKYFTEKDVTKLSDRVSGCIDCPVVSPLPTDWKKCFDCCYNPPLNTGCSTCNNPTITLDPSVVKNIQEYVKGFEIV